MKNKPITIDANVLWERLVKVKRHISWPAEEESQGREWTKAVDLWFRKITDDGDVQKDVCSYLAPGDSEVKLVPYSQESKGEYRWDHVWSVETSTKTNRACRYVGLYLVMECEWAWKSHFEDRLEAILEDYFKILDANAPLRVMVFDSGFASKEYEGKLTEKVFDPLHYAALNHTAMRQALEREEAEILLIDMDTDVYKIHGSGNNVQLSWLMKKWWDRE